MKLGILSDSHGRAKRVRRAIALLREAGAAALMHCGDVGGQEVIDELGAAGLPAWFVWGNTDYPDPALARYAADLGITPPGEPPLRIELAGKRLAVFHGHEPGFEQLIRLAREGDAEALAAAAAADYILHGHTHVAADTRIGSVRIINPGALHRASEPTVAVLDLATDELRFITVD